MPKGSPGVAARLLADLPAERKDQVRFFAGHFPHFAAQKLGIDDVVAESDEGNNTADMYRFITYIGYKFSDKIVMNTELEFEHGTTSDRVQYSRDGEYIRDLGRLGGGPGEFQRPFDIGFSDDGRVIVRDQAQRRVHIFSPEGDLLGDWREEIITSVPGAITGCRRRAAPR